MAEDRIHQTGRRLGEAWLAARAVDPFPEALRAGSRAEICAVQNAMAAVVGQPVTGWKLRPVAVSTAMRPVRIRPVAVAAACGDRPGAREMRSTG